MLKRFTRRNRQAERKSKALEERFKQGYWELAPHRIRAYLPRGGRRRTAAALFLLGVGVAYVAVLIGVLPLGFPLDAPAPVHVCILAAWLVGLITIGAPGLEALLHRARVRKAVRSGAGAALCDFGWSPAGIEDREHEEPMRRLGGVIVLTLVLIPLCWRLFVSDSGHWTIAVGLLGLIVALFLACASTALVLPNYLTHRRGQLCFNQFPYHPGDRLSVDFSPNKYPNPRFTLRYIDQATPEDTRAYGGLVIRHSERVLPALSALDYTVHIEFDLPDEPALVTRMSAADICYWELRMDVQSPKYEYETSFPLPVYPREDG